MTLDPTTGDERLVKSAERVRELAEVFTPGATVQAMLDLLPAEMWAIHPAATFLEPSCGDGNFLVAILDRKLRSITDALHGGVLPAGSGAGDALFHGLEALASVYGVDISADNIIGGTPGHEVGARRRLLDLFAGWALSRPGPAVDDASRYRDAARWIVTQNIQVGNMLPSGPDGRPTGRDDLPLMEYLWQPETGEVEVRATTLGAVMAQTSAETTGVMSLFGPPEPTLIWKGRAEDLSSAEGTTPGTQGDTT